jgi:prepilin-type N-terminal cleavage/methylation domain-containing protein
MGGAKNAPENEAEKGLQGMIGTMKKIPRAGRATGFTLIEIVMVLLIFGIVIAMAAAITRGVAASQKRSLTTTRMAGIDAALVQFVQQQRRLPCPADGTKASSDNNAGVEGARNAGGCTTNQQDGIVPWRVLALTETDATDGWDRRLTYRLDPLLGADGGMDISWCDPAGTQVVGTPALCNTGCVATNMALCTKPVDFLRGRGLTVKNVAGTVLMDPQTATALPPTGAAYVLMSHGESGGGAYLNSGTLATSTVGDGNEEMKNYASLPYTPGVTYYVDDALQETPGVNHFDDVVSRPSISGVSSKAGLAPRSH